jgi:hypothetical protein
MKTFLLAVAIGCSMLSYAKGPGVDERVLAAFNTTFKNANNVSWTELANTYEVKFSDNNIQMRVVYDKEGNMVNTLRYYNEDKLPVLILTKVKAKYPGKTIYGVTEESSDDGLYYHIILEDSKTWLTVKSDSGGSLHVEKKLKKG